MIKVHNGYYFRIYFHSIDKFQDQWSNRNNISLKKVLKLFQNVIKYKTQMLNTDPFLVRKKMNIIIIRYIEIEHLEK